MWASVVSGLVGGLAKVIRYHGDIKKARRFVRRGIIAPRLYTLHQPSTAEAVAKDIVDYMWGARGDASVITGLAWYILDKTIFVAKRRLIKETILRQAHQIQAQVTVRIDEDDDYLYDVTKGRDELEDFVKMILTVVGG